MIVLLYLLYYSLWLSETTANYIKGTLYNMIRYLYIYIWVLHKLYGYMILPNSKFTKAKYDSYNSTQILLPIHYPVCLSIIKNHPMYFIGA